MSERTEQPTPKRLREARRQGLVPRSALWTGAVAVTTASLLAWWWAESLWGRWRAMAARVFKEAGALSAEQGAEHAAEHLSRGLGEGLWVVSVGLGLVWGAVAVAALVQVGPGFDPDRLWPSWSRLSPFRERRQTVGRALGDLGLRVWVALGVGAASIGAGYELLWVWARRPWETLSEGVSALGAAAVTGGQAAIVVWLVLALADAQLQRWRWRQDVKMTREERRREQGG